MVRVPARTGFESRPGASPQCSLRGGRMHCNSVKKNVGLGGLLPTKIKVLAAQVRDYLDIGSERLLARMFNKETLNIFMPKLYGTYFLAVLRCRWSQKCLRSGAGAAKAIYGWSWAGAENNNFGSSTLLFVTIIIAALINNSYRYLIVLCGT